MGQKRKATGANALQRNNKRQKADAAAPPKKPKPTDSSTTSKSTLIFEPRPDWHAAALPSTNEESKPAPPSWLTDKLLENALKLLQTENATYQSQLAGSSSHKFLNTIMASGTLEDRISALTLVVQESPLHTMKAFDNLVGLSKKKSRDQALKAIAALKDLLGQGAVLPPDRKLRAFAKQPALQGLKTVDPLGNGIHEVHLIAWAYEDWLKKKYFELLQILEGWSSDLPYAKSRAITYTYELLRDKPEQEDNLLRLLANKLGDTEGKIASRASHLLLQLQVSHPAMKAVIVDSITDCLFKPGQSESTKYYAVITLNQTELSDKQPEVANKLIEVYFSLFVQLLSSKPQQKPQIGPQVNAHGSVQGGGGKAGKLAAKKRKAEERLNERLHEAGSQARDKLLSQVLTGVNRALRYADPSSFEQQIDSLYKVTHSANFNTAVQALTLLQKITAGSGPDRFYRTLYESLLDPRLITSSKQVMYLNLLYKSLKADSDLKRVQAFIKRLLQVVNMHEAPFTCSALFLVAELMQTPSIGRMISEVEIEDEEEHFYDAPEKADNIPKSLTSGSTATTKYDPRKRDPAHAHAELSVLWDALTLLPHFHPSVSLFAESMMDAKLPPKPDPAKHTLLHFLDKFAFRNPKIKATVKGASIMQPMIGAAAADLLAKPVSRAAAPVNTEAFWQQKAENVAPDEVFFHSYFNAGSKKSKTKVAQRTNSDEDSDEGEIWQAIAKSRPEVEGADSADEDDLSIGDLESAYSDSGSEGGIDLGGGDMPELESDDGAYFDDDDEIDVDVDVDVDAVDTVDEQTDEPAEPKKKDGGKRRGKKLKHLPTFASAEDYAKLLADEPDE